MNLLAQELIETQPLEQQIVATDNVLVTNIRPRLYIANSPSGSVRLDIYDEAGTTLLSSSDSRSITGLKTLSYAHGRYNFTLNFGAVKSTVYRVRLVGIGYTFGATDYIAWCRDFDFRVYGKSFTANTTGVNSPFEMEIWRKTTKIRKVPGDVAS